MSVAPQGTEKHGSSREIPPLVAGDRLTREEFHRRYEAMPHVKKAELIEGVVYMSYRVPFEGHAVPYAHFAAWLGHYCAFTRGVQAAVNCTVVLDPNNEPQPDVLLRLLPECGGQSKTVNDYVHGAPELVAEIAFTSASYDLHDKLNAYRRSGVREYVVWLTWDREIDWFVLRGGRYEALTAQWDGFHRSEVFPGLWLDGDSMLRGDLARVLEVARYGIASSQHAEFVKRLDDVSKNRE
jgi:Uma2 family endonuclease